MRYKLLHDAEQRTYALAFDPDDEVMENLRGFAEQQNLIGSSFTGIGALKSAELGFYDPGKKEHHVSAVDEQVDLLSLVGNVAEHRDAPQPHAHVVLGKRDGSTLGGRLLKGIVRPTVEIVLTESPTHLHREIDEATGLPLITIDET